MGLKKQIKAAINIFRRFDGFKGKIYAVGVILNEIRKSFTARTGIELNLPFRFGRRRFDFLSEPVGVVNLWALDQRLKPLNPVVSDEPTRINVLLPDLNPRIIFGGYIAILNFILRLTELGYRVRIVVCEEVDFNEEQIRKSCKEARLANEVLQHVELIVVADRSAPLFVSRNDIYFGYSWLTMRLASRAAQDTNENLPVFFIQEFEAIFHPYDSFRALCIATYDLPHFALFNSELLTRFFRKSELGVFDPRNPAHELKHSHSYFSHAISDIKAPTVEAISSREKTKLLYYARPEAHASRNIFEIGVLALREALEKGVFDASWEFYGIGSLSLSGQIELAEGITMKILPRVSLEEYCRLMSDFDVGLALMYAPHPSVPPFEMAAAGMLTVTTTFESRSSEDSESISRNLIAASPDPSSVANAIQDAVERVGDYESRVQAAKFQWPRTWKETFNDELMESLVDVLPSREN